VDLLHCKITEYARPWCRASHISTISLVTDVSPFCDCHDENDAPVLPDVGMFASFDPVALDTACAEALLKTEPLPGSALAEEAEPHRRPLPRHAPDHQTGAWASSTASASGLGTTRYELIEV
jgi:uncharacterized Fe-S center protein